MAVRLREITRLDVPELEPYRTMRDQRGHLGGGVFVAEGGNVVRRLIESPLALRSVLVPPKHAGEFEMLLAAHGRAADLFVAPFDLLETLTGFHIYQGILAIGEVPAPSALDSILALRKPLLLAAVDGLTGAENIGAIIRNAAAFGAQALLMGETSAHPYLRRSVRCSMGTVFRMPYLVADDLAAVLGRVRLAGTRVVAAHAHADQRTLYQCDLRPDTCLVFGAEGDGLRPAVLAACDEAVRIPMCDGVDSLNVASASAVFLAEARRQRG
jgi:tRNA G18 (ribose-2'-O)-methylase SpoU